MTGSYSLDLKLAVVRRMDGGCAVSALSREVGIHRAQLYRWYRAWKAHGEAGLRPPGRRGRAQALAAGRAPVPVAALEGDDLPPAIRERLALLESKVGQQQLELDFFKHALRHLEEARQPQLGSGGPASTPASGR
ncbi:helix-turn-helix domain-containing protein [Azospirillum sp. sgz301742]